MIEEVYSCHFWRGAPSYKRSINQSRDLQIKDIAWAGANSGVGEESGSTEPCYTLCGSTGEELDHCILQSHNLYIATSFSFTYSDSQ